MNDLELDLAWLYPSLMSTYSDRGNIFVLVQRGRLRNIKINILPIETATAGSTLEKADFIFGGGSQDRQQEIVMRDLRKEKGKILKQLIDQNKVGLFTCGSPQLLGHYYEPAVGKRIDGLGIFDFTSVSPGLNTYRCIGNIIIEVTGIALDKGKSNYLVGFENHGGRTFLSHSVRPLGKVLKGFGNNGKDKTEGAVYKNAVATYLHGPILPKNPHLADYLLVLALENKYQKKIELKPIDDSLEWQAHWSVVKKILGQN
ncbi:cobalamin biosynthesis protein CobQ [Candidatus Microgenomates bacterium]|nr:cobalamin biosynthesis protein CobQ [Candidatus Microgenomates bacterium]